MHFSSLLVTPASLQCPHITLQGATRGPGLTGSGLRASLFSPDEWGFPTLDHVAWPSTSCEGEWGSWRPSPHALGEEGSWLGSFLSLQLPPGTVWNFYFSVFVCKGEVWASLHNFHSMGPGKGICTGVLKGEGGAGGPRGGCYWQEARCACFSEGQREGSMTERRLSTPLRLSCHTGPSC